MVKKTSRRSDEELRDTGCELQVIDSPHMSEVLEKREVSNKWIKKYQI